MQIICIFREEVDGVGDCATEEQAGQSYYTELLLLAIKSKERPINERAENPWQIK